MNVSPTASDYAALPPAEGTNRDKSPVTAVVRTSTVGVRIDVAASLSDYVRQMPIGSRARAESFIATFLNPYSALRVRHEQSLSQLLDRFDLVMPDGIGLCVAVRHLHRRRAARVSFDSTSLAPIVFAAACRYGSTIALVGGAPGVATRAAERLRVTFPGIRIVATFDGYQECDLALRTLPSLAPDIVICGMGTGQQEMFLIELQERGWNGCGFTCGGYLDQLNEGFLYYPAWVDALNFRWAFRLFREPRRLWRRYMIDYPYFVLLVLQSLLMNFSGGASARSRP